MLTDQQLVFCRNVVDGKNQTEAYLDAYPNCRSRASARAAAPRLLANVSILRKIKQLRSQVESAHCMTWLDKRRLLGWIMMNPETPVLAVLRAIEIDNKMAGHDKPPEPEVNNALDELLNRIRSQKD